MKTRVHDYTIVPPRVQVPVVEAETLVDLLRQRANEQPERKAYAFLTAGEINPETLSFGQLERRARAIAALLQSVKARGERVLLLYPPGLEYVSGFMGCLYAGAVAVPVPPPRIKGKTHRVQMVAADSQASIVLTTQDLLSKLDAMGESAPELRSLRWVATDNIDLSYGEYWREPQIDGETLAFLQYTSGSTGRPKGVMVTHGNLLHNERLIQKAFNQTEQSVILSWLPLYHDMGLIGGVLQPLYLGARCILTSPFTFLQNPLAWLRMISEYQVTTSGGPNFAYALCVRKAAQEDCSGIDLSSWKCAFNGSEPIRAETLESFCQTFAPFGFSKESFFPCYGLAEATLLVSGGNTTPQPLVRTVCGKALKRNTVADIVHSEPDSSLLVASGSIETEQELVIVDPESLTQCGGNEVGEIWVSGPSITSGYYNRPAETAETFNARLAGTNEGPFLRTGDLGFVRDGALYVTGRLKELIIIRGQNYYPHDVEATVQSSVEGLRAGAGAAFSVEVAGEERLIIIQELDRNCRRDPNEIIKLIRQAIADEHQIPPLAVSLVKAGTVPKTSSGKIQRRACRSQFLQGLPDVIAQWTESQLQQDSEAAVTLNALPGSVEALSQSLISWLAAKLAVEPSAIDASQPISSYGLDSMGTIEFMHSLETNLGVALPMTTFFQIPSLTQLAELIYEQLNNHANGSTLPTPLPDQLTEFDLSRGQQALYFLNQLVPDSPAFNLAALGLIRNSLDVPALHRAFQKLVERHPALRTNFIDTPDGPIQRIQDEFVFFCGLVDGTAWTEKDLNDRILAEANRSFNLQRDALLRITLYQRPQGFLLLMVVHHIVSDFWSFGLIFNELGILYTAEKTGTAALLPMTVARYCDYVEHQREMLEGPRGEQLWNYWKEKLAGELPRLELRTDRPRKAIQNHVGDSISFTIDSQATAGLRRLSHECGTTLFTTLATALMTLLHRYTGQEELLLGTVTSGRRSARFADVVGYFVNPVVLKGEFSGQPNFKSMLSRMHTTVTDALAHQDYPFPALVEGLQPANDATRSPLIQVMLVYQQAHLPGQESLTRGAVGKAGAVLRMGELEIESLPLNQRTGQFELMFRVTATENEICGSLDYDTDLFDASTIKRMLDHFHTLVQGILISPDLPLSDLTLLTEAEQRQVEDWNKTQKEYAGDKRIHTLFEAQVECSPDAVALVYEDQSLTYRELNARANRLAHYLERSGVGPEVRVGLFAERSLEMVIGLLGILKAGGAYVPIDPSYPAPRISFMIGDATVAALLTQQHLLDRIPTQDAPVIVLDSDWPLIAAESDENPTGTVLPDNAAYVIYTSGSTGQPKGAVNTHAAVCNRLLWGQDNFGLTAADRVLQKTPFSFDVSVWEFFWPLIAGARLILTRPEGHQDSAYLLDLIAKQEITTIHFVSSMLQIFLEETELASCSSLKRVLCSGEALPLELQERFFARLGADLYNLYGPTEAAIEVTWWECTRDNRLSCVPIGRPIANTRIYLLDDKLRPVPVGVAGELYIAGDAVARGYLNRFDLTAEKFIPDPYGCKPGALMYRSGDLARYLPDGEIEFLGRVDQQVKLRGQRIELGEIEAALDQHSLILLSAVILHKDFRGEQRLVAFVTTEYGEAFTTREMREFLKGRLPAYMIPSLLIKLDSMPLTASGKISRKGLPAIEQGLFESERGFDAPRTPVEQVLAGLWADILALDQVGIHDDFFEIGGHSILAARLVSQIKEIFQFELSLRTFFEERTVARLAAVMVADAAMGSTVQRIAELAINVANFTDNEVETMLGVNQLSIDKVKGNEALF